MSADDELREVFGRADAILLELGRTVADLETANSYLDKEVAELRARWQAKIVPLEEEKKRLEHEVTALAKANRDRFFAGESERLELPHGALLYEVQRRVKRARGVLERLEAEGFWEAVKVAKSVDWDALETWPEERLIFVGTERIKKELYAYEVNHG